MWSSADQRNSWRPSLARPVDAAWTPRGRRVDAVSCWSGGTCSLALTIFNAAALLHLHAQLAAAPDGMASTRGERREASRGRAGAWLQARLRRCDQRGSSVDQRRPAVRGRSRVRWWVQECPISPSGSAVLHLHCADPLSSSTFFTSSSGRSSSFLLDLRTFFISASSFGQSAVEIRCHSNAGTGEQPREAAISTPRSQSVPSPFPVDHASRVVLRCPLVVVVAVVVQNGGVGLETAPTPLRRPSSRPLYLHARPKRLSP